MGILAKHFTRGNHKPSLSNWNLSTVLDVNLELLYNYFQDFTFMGPCIVMYFYSKLYFTFMGPCIVMYFYSKLYFYSKCTIFQFTEYHSTCFRRSFLSSSVQDCTHSIRYMPYRSVDCLLPGHDTVPGSKQSTNLYDICLMLSVQS